MYNPHALSSTESDKAHCTWQSRKYPHNQGQQEHPNPAREMSYKEDTWYPIVQPPVQAASVEEMPAGDPVRHRVELEPGPADRAFVFVLGRGTEEGSEPGRGDPTPKLLSEGREFGRIRLGFIEIGRLREVDADEVKDRPYDLLEDGDRDRRVYEDDCEDAFGRGGEAREPHLE